MTRPIPRRARSTRLRSPTPRTWCRLSDSESCNMVYMTPETKAELHLKAACGILHNMALERNVSLLSRCFRRWHISDEPLRNDAANFLRRIRFLADRPIGTKYVGE